MKKKLNNCLAFTLIELLVVLILISLLSYVFLFKSTFSSTDIAIKRLILYLNQTRLQAFIDNPYDSSDTLWHKKRWSLKFMRCKKNVGGLYYVIYSDKNKTGHPSLKESLKDPLTQKAIYSTNSCQEQNNTSSYVLLTKKYGIDDVNISCNSTSSLGQISFGEIGSVYTKLSANENGFDEYKLYKPCFLTFYVKNQKIAEIKIHPFTGYVEKIF